MRQLTEKLTHELTDSRTLVSLVRLSVFASYLVNCLLNLYGMDIDIEIYDVIQFRRSMFRSYCDKVSNKSMFIPKTLSLKEFRRQSIHWSTLSHDVMCYVSISHASFNSDVEYEKAFSMSTPA